MCFTDDSIINSLKKIKKMEVIEKQVKEPSPRELLQNEIVTWLEQRSDRFNRDILSSLDPVENGKGKVRTISFGINEKLDATLFVFSVKDIRVKAEGPLAIKFQKQKYVGFDDLLDDLSEF